MRNRMSLLPALLLMLAAAPAAAELSQRDLDKRVTMTEKAALLQQVDTVSLYLSSERVKLAPRLTDAGVVDVEMTVLDPYLAADRARLRDFVVRNVTTFNDVLAERLPIYAPALAKEFDAKRDVRFRINRGAARVPVATWSGGQFAWVAGTAAPAADEDLNTVRAMDAGPKGCDCPARRK